MRRRLLLPLFAAALLAAQPLVEAQAPATEASTGSKVMPDKAMRPIDLNLSGPTNVQDYVSYLQDATGMNIVLLGDRGVDLSKIQLPPLRLKQMPAATAIALLSDLPGARISVEPRDNAYLVIAHAPDVIIGRNGPLDENGRMIERPVTKVFSLEQVFFGNAGLTETPLDIDERAKKLADKVPQTLKLIEEALTLDGETTGEQAVIKLHEATNTLIIRGTLEQLATVQEVLKAIAPQASEEARIYATKLQETQLNADRVATRLQNDLQATKNYLVNVQADLAAARKKVHELEAKQADQRPTTLP